MNYTLFISDLHLEADRPDITQCFFNLLKNQALHADALYILGDLFEVWIGDDDLSPFNQSVLAAIKELVATKVPVYFLPGNRDFLIGQEFCRNTGCKLLPDPHKISLYGTPIVLTHGDRLCTQDIKHQKFRHYSLNPRYQRIFLQLPLKLRRFIAYIIRSMSKRHTSRSAPSMMDVAHEAVISILGNEQAKQLIHGHTHQPNIHHLNSEGVAAQRIVLGDWHQQGSTLIYYADGQYELQTIKF